jgi:hypothetical protein
MRIWIAIFSISAIANAEMLTWGQLIPEVRSGSNGSAVGKALSLHFPQGTKIGTVLLPTNLRANIMSNENGVTLAKGHPEWGGSGHQFSFFVSPDYCGGLVQGESIRTNINKNCAVVEKVSDAFGSLVLKTGYGNKCYLTFEVGPQGSVIDLPSCIGKDVPEQPKIGAAQKKGKASSATDK